MEHPEERERRRQNSTEEGESFDYISRLPDPIIHHILSLLPSEYLYRTSVLSKAWHHSASTCPILELRFSIPEQVEYQKTPWDENGFYEQVERCIHNFYRDVHSLQAFTLQIDFPTSNSVACSNRILDLVAAKNVFQDQALHITGHPSVIILVANSITVLELRRSKLSLEGLYVRLPNLQKLSFLDCTFSGDHVFHEFLFGSPSVEHLSISNCDGIESEIDGGVKIRIPGARLKHFDCLIRKYYATVEVDIQSHVLHTFTFVYSPFRLHNLWWSSSIHDYPYISIDFTKYTALKELKLESVSFEWPLNQLNTDIKTIICRVIEVFHLKTSWVNGSFVFLYMRLGLPGSNKRPSWQKS